MNNKRLTKEYEIFDRSSINKLYYLDDCIKCNLESTGIYTRMFSLSYGDVLKLDCTITYPETYPFCPPVWTLLKIIIKEDIQSIDLKEYYENIVSNHNIQYAFNWSPLIRLEKDILDFIQKINHFEYIFDTVYIADNKIRNIFRNLITEELMMYVWHPSRFDTWKYLDTDLDMFY